MSAGGGGKTHLAGAEKQQLIEAFKGEQSVAGSLLEDKVGFDGPWGVVDPRLVGYTYLSYMFIESADELATGFEADKGLFADRERALMIGATLGEYDFIHRRAEVSKYRHADFAVDAIEREEFAFMKNVETYPLFTIGRWHGQDVPVRNMTLRREVMSTPADELSDLEAELLFELVRNPEADHRTIEQHVRERAANNASLFEDEAAFEDAVEPADAIKDTINALQATHVLGQSVSIDPANISNFNHTLVGISVKEGVNLESTEPYDLPNEKVIDQLRQTPEFDGWRMPYIVSGVGKAWGDVVVEMHIDDIDDMERYAEIIRDVDGVRSTRTFAMTGTSFHEPLILGSPDQIRTRAT